MTEQPHIAIIGLGYVGVPLAVEFARHFPVTGFDINANRALQLSQGIDYTGEVSADELLGSERLCFTNQVAALADCTVFVVTVPTPIDRHKRPDLTALRKASQAIAGVLKAGDTVIYESTVYPGCTEEVCVPLLEQHSGLRFNRDFFVGYSPERINPGDKQHRLADIRKVTSGSTPATADFVDRLYRRIIRAGTHQASSIRVAEAAKVIENTQRDLNIALINELAIIFNRLGIDTREVLDAAASKWNFLPFSPGLVGGHCISVDPYYLTHKAQEIGYHPEVILAGRRINDSMGAYIAEQVIKLMTRKLIHVVESDILVLGFTFKENCPDIRNTQVVSLVRELQSYHASVDIVDPLASSEDSNKEYGLTLFNEIPDKQYDAVILAVAHRQFAEPGIDGIKAVLKPAHIIYDVKHILPADAVDGRL
ncbi:MAG TPA: nucleotide sugar dehydrogenase [Pseudomonadales bacterium]